MNIPNIISSFRIILIPIFIYSFKLSMLSNSYKIPIFIFILAGISDVIDGYIARRYNMQTKLGAVLDPLADKLMLITAISCFTYSKHIPLWMLIIIFVKESLMIIGGTITYKEGIVTKANIFGKLATFLFHLSIFAFLINDNLAIALLTISIISSLFAFIVYLKIVLEKRNKLKNSKD